MYPDLSYFMHDLLGTPYDNGFSIIKMYGLMLALAFLCALIVFRSELKRHARLKNFSPQHISTKKSSTYLFFSIIINYVYVFLLGYKIGYIALNWSDFLADPSGILLSKLGNLYLGLLAVVLMIALDFYKKTKLKEEPVQRQMYPHDYAMQITFIAAISGVLGAKLLSIAEEPSGFIADPIGTLFSGSGLTIYGGIIGGFIACTIFLKVKKIGLLRVWDSAAPALLVGYGVGRLGCHLAGDGDWGKVNTSPAPDWFIFPDWLWSYHYPHNIINKGALIADCAAKYCRELSPPVFPTSLYEIAMVFGLFTILWASRKKIKIQGLIFSIYLIFNGIERFIIEFVRINKKYEFLGCELSQAQYIAIGMVLIGLVSSVNLTIKYGPQETSMS